MRHALSSPISSANKMRRTAAHQRPIAVQPINIGAPLSDDTERMLPDARRWSRQLERIEALSRELSRSRDVHSVAEAVASEIASVIDWQGLRFFVVARDDETLEAIVLRSTVPHYANETPERLRIPIGK